MLQQSSSRATSLIPKTLYYVKSSCSHRSRIDSWSSSHSFSKFYSSQLRLLRQQEMCIAFLIQNTPTHNLILASNRDENFNRKTANAEFHNDILSPIDLEGGGTWIGISRSGDFSMILNFRQDPAKVSRTAPSRGELVTNFLSSNVSPKEYINSINSQLYNGFNLITGRIGGEFWYLGNKGGPSGDGGMMKLAENTPYGISNGILADFYGRDWPKVEYGKRLFYSILQKVCFALISRALKVNNCSENY